ncbi:MAG: hypothetical protein LBE38_03650 [Deltaproteobacteria bacterium]|jgi:hypothetical protein|nr:hypothetical protein [Deltaproteobacteria bacterium]
MAKDLTIGDKKVNCNNPGCDSAAFCCWYETTKEFSNICTNRNNLVCQLRRDEVFGDSEEGQKDTQWALAKKALEVF